MDTGAKPSFASTTVGLAVGVTAAVVLACVGGAYLYSKHHMRSLLATARATALAEGDLIRVALEHQMIENDRTLIAGMMESFRTQSWVERLVLLDRGATERELDLPPDQAGSSRVLEPRNGDVLRAVIPIRNRAECYGCHDPGHKINGVLILDYRTAGLAQEMAQDLRWMVAGTAAITFLLVGAIGLVIRVAVLRRLQRFETAARQIAGGDLDRRVPAGGTDTISWLAREFNTMADSVTGLVGEVRHQRERLETVINSIDDGIVVLDAQRRVIAANDAFLERARHSREQVLGCQCRDLTPGGCTVQDCPTLSCLGSGARQVRLCERRTPEGKVVWEEVHASPILDSQRKLLHVVEVWRDISDRRAAEAHLAESHRLASLGTLASGFSHELNTPLATVLTCVEGILRETSGNGADAGADDGRIRESAAIAREQILRCRGITQHFLRLSRGQRGQGDIVDLGPVIAAVARLIEPTAREHSVKVEVRRVPSGMLVRADEAEIQHTLINLLLNAVQASKAGGQVTVETESAQPLRIRVIDHGCGIAEDDLKRIFDPFFSVRQGGTGLGLFLSLNFVRRWGGQIQVTSVIGCGSTFEVILPALEST
jgi:two-component system sensor histidine kinase AtoS